MNPKEIAKDHERLWKNLRLIQKSVGIKNLCALLDISMGTWSNRMKAPWQYFSYDDLRTIARFCKIDFVQIVDGELNLK